MKLTLDKKLKVVLIGTGGWAGHHARILSQHPLVDFCGIAGRNAERTAARATQYRTRPYTSIPLMLETEKPDLVSICLPNQEHFEITRQVIRAGHHLMVEKPLVFDLAEADTLIAEAEARKLFFAINFNHRYAKPLVMAKAAIDNGDLGDITFAQWRFGEGNSTHPFANLIETQCHGFDQLEHLVGPIDSIMAQMTDKAAAGFHTMALALHFANGAVGTFLGTYNSSYNYPGTHALEVNGTRGRIVVQDTVRSYSFQPINSETAQTWQAGYFNDYDREFQRTFDSHMNAILEAFCAGQPPPIPASAGRRALQLAHGAMESFRSGTRVTISAR